jgi:hypothetical protein
MKKYIEEDEIGQHRVIEQGNGIKIRILEKPSDWYKKKQKDNAAKERERQAVRDVEKEKEKLIKNKMRELAISELQKEGKI